jgi:transcriptional regulator with XRE-family HTH domain
MSLKKRVEELARQRGLSMAGLAKLLGIERANLASSLDGNPTLSRLESVARILHLDVPDLFEKEEKPIISGYLEYNGKIMKVNSVEGLRTVLAEVDREGNTLTLKRETVELLMNMKKAYEEVYNRQFDLDGFIEQMSASVEGGDVAVWEEYCKSLL